MNQERFYYLIRLQYLGYRLHGWQRQPKLKTVESLLLKTLKFILPKQKIKLLGSSRTDAMVSAEEAAFELFLEKPLADPEDFLQLFNKNLPPDIKALHIEEKDAAFNIIQHPKLKEYAYLFSFGTKNHPFCAPYMANFQEELDLELMKEGALCFEGTHNFKNYSARASENSRFERAIVKARIEENHLISASFFPDKSYVFHVHGRGFLRQQVRLMMGALVSLGKGDISLDQIQSSLQPQIDFPLDYIAPASGLILNKIYFE